MEISNQIKQIYNTIANDFNKSRVRIWPCVSDFLKTFEPGSEILDIGCGNGKNMLYRLDLKFKGIDFSNKLVEICKEKGLDVIEGSMTSLPYKSHTFDGAIAIASYHHLSTENERKQTLNEIYRVLKTGAQALIVVWAMEQPEDSTFKFTKSDELVSWKTKAGETHYRYYHIYSEGDLEAEIVKLKPEFKILNIGWQKGNWYAQIEK
jgi:ubiquinone/menaquinone biosynthesis C-methylase UbiE